MEIRLSSASVDEETNEVTLVFYNIATSADPDPATFSPTHKVTLVVPGAVLAPIYSEG